MGQAQPSGFRFAVRLFCGHTELTDPDQNEEYILGGAVNFACRFKFRTIFC